MHAAWYEHGGTTGEVLNVGEMEAPQPGPGEILVRVRLRDQPRRHKASSTS